MKSVLERLQHLEEHGSVRRPPRELIPKTEPSQGEYRSPTQDSNQSPVASTVSGSSRSVHISPESLASTGIWPKEPSEGLSNGSSHGRENLSLDLDRETAQRWIDAALSKNMFQRFLGLVDMEVLKAMPGIIDSGYVRFDPAVLLIYYVLIMQGSFDDLVPQVCFWRHRIYQQCLSIVPDWTRSPKLTDMDFTAAFLILWMAIGCYDNLSHWNLFCQTCHIANELGIHDLESHPEGEHTVKDDTRRILFWQLLRIECNLRLFQKRPPVLTAKPWNVNLPSVSINGARDAMDATLATICMLHARLTLVVFDCCKILDDGEKTQGEARMSLEKAVQQIRGLLVDWQLEESFEKVPGLKHKMYYADTLVFGYSLIVELVRRIGVHAHPELQMESRRSARRVLDVMTFLGDLESPEPEYRAITLSIISANPFIPFFALRDFAIADTDRDTARMDFEMLSGFANMVMEGAKAQGFHSAVPFAQHLLETSRGDGLHFTPLI